MSLKKVNPEQPKTFEFSEKFKNVADKILKKYPEKRKKCRDAFFIFSSKTE